MEHYVFSPPDMSAVPVNGGGLFPVRRIFCVGRKCAEHVREMGGDP
jgi:fumarylpyruvate hydrolase